MGTDVMPTGSPPPKQVLRSLWALCVLVPVICVWGAGCVFLVLTDRSHVIPQVASEWVANSAMAAAPFLALAYWGSCRSLTPQAAHFGRSLAAIGALGTVLTSLFWGAFYYEGYTYWAEHKTSGVPMGSACLMVLSPLIVGAAMVFGLWLFGTLRKEPRHN
jgi:hypothetical protein